MTDRQHMLLAWIVALVGVIAWIVAYETWWAVVALMVTHAMVR